MLLMIVITLLKKRITLIRFMMSFTFEKFGLRGISLFFLYIPSMKIYNIMNYTYIGTVNTHYGEFQEKDPVHKHYKG